MKLKKNKMKIDNNPKSEIKKFNNRGENEIISK